MCSSKQIKYGMFKILEINYNVRMDCFDSVRIFIMFYFPEMQFW